MEFEHAALKAGLALIIAVRAGLPEWQVDERAQELWRALCWNRYSEENGEAGLLARNLFLPCPRPARYAPPPPKVKKEKTPEQIQAALARKAARMEERGETQN